MSVDVMAVAAISGGIAALSLILGIVSLGRVAKLQAGARALDGVTDLDGVPVSEILKAIATRIEAMSSRQDELAGTQTSMIQEARHYIRHASCVRYNAFENTGSDLSFSLAILDSRHSGLVLTGLYGRDDMRVYAKPVEGGISQYVLTGEEKKAISLASPR